MCSSTALAWWLCVHSPVVFCSFCAFTNPHDPITQGDWQTEQCTDLTGVPKPGKLLPCFWMSSSFPALSSAQQLHCWSNGGENRQLLLLIICPSLSSLAKLFTNVGRIFPLPQSISSLTEGHSISEHPELEGLSRMHDRDDPRVCQGTADSYLTCH